MRARRQLIDQVVRREREVARREAQARAPQIQSTYARAGQGRSSRIQLALYENDCQAAEQVMQKRIGAETETPLTPEDLAGDAWVKDAENDIRAIVQEEFVWLEERAREYSNRHGSGPRDFEQLFGELLKQDRSRILDFYLREVRILESKRQIAETVGAHGPGRIVEQTDSLAGADWLVPGPEPQPDECDAVTQLYARRIFNQDLPQWVALSEQERVPVSCLVLDLDNFKPINDLHGHDKGDEVLRRVAMELRSIVRGKGKAYRWGSGDELVALLLNHTAGEALAVAERVRSAVEALTFEGIDRSITVSVGGASYPELALNSDQLRTRADEALRMAKEAGKNRVQMYPDPRTPVKTEIWPSASGDEIANVLRYTGSSSVDVRGDSAKELLTLAYRKRLSHSEELLAAVEGLLLDDDEGIRGTALQIVTAIIHVSRVSEKSEGGSDLAARYATTLINIVERDPSTTVRGQAVAVIGNTGSPDFIETIFEWIQTWDQSTYVKVRPGVALTGLAAAGLGVLIRNKLRDVLEKEESEGVKQQLRECLNEVNSVIR